MAAPSAIFLLNTNTSSASASSLIIPSSTNPIIVTICTIFGLIELTICCPTLPMVVACSAIIGRTQILHKNLKIILLAQFLCIFLFILCRIFLLLGEMVVYKNVFWYPSNALVAFEFWLSMFSNVVGHVLMVERILATVLVHRYELYSGKWFTITWPIVTFVLCSILCYEQVYVSSSLVSFSTILVNVYLVQMAINFTEIFAFILLMRFNKRLFMTRYGQKINNIHQLSTRYQLTENIQTGQQLAPNFICHFIGVLLSFVYMINGVLQIVTDDPDKMATFLQFVLILHAINHFMLPILMIRCHPILNRKARAVLLKIRRILCQFRRSNAIAPRDISTTNVCVGQSSRRSAETEIHFRQLDASWNAHRRTT